MKYLKLFENLYEKRPEDEFNMYGERLIKFNNDEVNKIRRVIYNAGWGSKLEEDMYCTSKLTSYEYNYIASSLNETHPPKITIVLGFLN